MEIAPGNFQQAHRDQLRKHFDDVYAGKPFPLHYFSGKAPEVEPVLKDREYIVDDDGILAHRIRNGVLEFKVKWRGYEEPDWQPVENLQNDALSNYMTKNNLGWYLRPSKTQTKPH